MIAKAILSFVVVAGLTVLGSAQAGGPPSPPPGGMMMRGGPMGEAMRGFGDGKQVKGAPMSGVLSVTRDTTLANGTTIHNVSETKIYRDSEGRVRREFTLELNLPATGAVKRNMVLITDPVGGYRYLLNPENKTVRQMPLHRGKRHGEAGGPGASPPPPNGKFDPASIKTEQLGSKSMNGLQAEGTRVTRTIAAGEIGNDKPIEVVTERWVSTDLQIPLLVVHNDPMMGVVTTTLTNINRGEPDASLFQVPSDYKAQTGRANDPFYVPMQP